MNEQSVAILGKNGFVGTLGIIKPLVTNYSVSASNLVFTISNLNLMYDENFDCHILEARQNVQFTDQTNYVPDNLLNFTINVKTSSTSSGVIEGLVGHESTLAQATANITFFDLSANTISVDFGTAESATAVESLLLPEPFYVNMYQLIDKRFSSSNTFYISGGIRIVSNTHNVVGQTGTVILPINTRAPNKGLIEVYVNGSTIKQDISNFSYTPGNAFIELPLASTYRQVRTLVRDYTVPRIEPNDNLFIHDNQQLVSVNSVSYITTSASYNAALYASDFFKIKLTDNLASNVSSTSITNVTPDLIADISSINSALKTLTVTYDDTIYPYTYDMTSEFIYNMIPLSFSAFKDVTLDDGIFRVPSSAEGTYIFKVVSINELNRTSAPVTASVTFDALPLGQVSNLILEEVLFRDRTKGIMSRVLGSFEHIRNRNVTDYEISYKIKQLAGSDLHPSGLTNYNSFKVDASGVDDNNKINFVVNNLDLGKAGNIYELEVRVVPLNGVSKGIQNVENIILQGKAENPQGVRSFDVYQTDSSVVFDIDYPIDEQNNLSELDILHTEIRFKSPIDSIASNDQRLAIFNNSDILLLIPHPLTRAEISVDRVGSGNFTFTARTVDTSGNRSTDVAARNTNIQLSSTTEAIAAWSESDPTSNVLQNTLNQNYTENNFVAVTSSDNGGFVYDIDPVTSAILGINTPSTLAEDANASASGFIYDPDPSLGIDETDLIITNSTSSYISPIRDLGEVVRGSLVISSSVSTTLSRNFLELSDSLITGVAEDSSPNSNVLYDADFEIGTIVGFNNTDFSFSFSNTRGTVTATSPDTKIYAIYNPGQEVIGEVVAKDDTANAFTFALIAGAINAHAIEISSVFFANGTPVPGGNTSAGSVLSNLTQSGSTYKLVDLFQFNDLFAQNSFAPQLQVNKNVFVRFSSANVFEAADSGSLKPHGNVNLDLYDSTDLEDNWTRQYSGIRNFRFFQVRLDIDIPGYGEEANAYLDDYYYEVLAPRKTFTTTGTTTGAELGNIQIDFSSASFYNVPAVFCQVLTIGSYSAQPVDLTNISANVIIVNTQDGTRVTDPGIEILVSAIGA